MKTILFWLVMILTFPLGPIVYIAWKMGQKPAHA